MSSLRRVRNVCGSVSRPRFSNFCIRWKTNGWFFVYSKKKRAIQIICGFRWLLKKKTFNWQKLTVNTQQPDFDSISNQNAPRINNWVISMPLRRNLTVLPYYSLIVNWNWTKIITNEPLSLSVQIAHPTIKDKHPYQCEPLPNNVISR